MEDTYETALLLIASVKAALLNGVKHYAKDGTLLKTESEIITTLQKYNEVELDETDRVQRTTPEIELARFKAILSVKQRGQTYG